MIGKQKLKVKLPKFVIASELSRTFRYNFPDDLDIVSEDIVFDWSDVFFFDDYSLLKLIFLQRQIRSLGKTVKNRGFILPNVYSNRQAVMRQLWAVGLPELTASGHLISTEQLKNTLKDETQLLEGDPLYGLQAQATATTVIPMLCCHERKHFSTGSREEDQLDSFIRTCLRPSGQNFLSWDLVESREFRHLILQQLRRNVQEHSHSESDLAIGLAIVRVWTHQTLSDEWGLTEETKAELLSLWKEEPIPAIYQNLGEDCGILQISILDDGVGIPHNLIDVHERELRRDTQMGLFRLKYRDSKFDKEFKDPASWADEKARLIAFATDFLGTSKPDRPEEIKGLEFLRKNAVIERGGEACIESDGTAISHFTRNQPYGKPCQIRLAWCKSGGTGVCLAVPMSPVKSSDDIQKWVPHALDFKTSEYPGSLAKIIKVKEHLTGIKHEEIVACGRSVLGLIGISDIDLDRTQIRSKKLRIIDFSELTESKDIFHYLFVEIAKGFAETDTRQTQPFVFANLPKGICGLVGKAINMYSNPANRIPVLAFTAEQEEPFWIGLDDKNCIPADLRPKVSCEIRRKITDHKENRTEAFYRDCLGNLLSSEKPVSISHHSVLDCVAFDSRLHIKDSPAFSCLRDLVRRCTLFWQEKTRSFTEDEMDYTGRFQPVFQLKEILAEVRELFINKFCDVFTSPPVCFEPKNKEEGVLLPHSSRISARYFRSDALVDHPIAAELSQKLTSIAFGIAKQQPGGRIDWVVSCTSPPHWFVHRIVDGLAEYRMICSHYVFRSYEDILSSIEDIPMRSGETVLGFTDVIASGKTVFRMAESLVNHHKVRMAGLIALADIRTPEELESGPDINKIYEGRIFCLYNKSEPNRIDLKPAYYVHPETVVPKRVTETNPMDEFFHKNYAGTGPLVENHAYFGSPTRTLEIMKSLNAVRFGHFQHGSHHSEIFVDVEKILLCSVYRNIMVTAIFRYIINHDIRLVIYPSHSSAYLLAGDLRQRFESTSVEFIMACRTFRGVTGTSYALTRFSPYPEPQWKKFSSNAVLILDDAICSGETVKSIMSELVRIDRSYYEDQALLEPGFAGTRFSVHVVAFLNRLPRVTGDFWGGLSRIAAGRVQFSAFISMPLSANSEDLCPKCHIEDILLRRKNSVDYCLYAKEFLSWWISQGALLSSHERRHFDDQRERRFCSEEALKLAGYLSAIERHAYHSVRDNLFDKPGEPARENSIPVRVHVRSRAGFLHNLLPKADESEDMVGVLCEELGVLIDIAKNGSLSSNDDALEILKILTLRYMRMRPTRDEVERVMEILLIKLAHEFDDRLIVGGVASILDSCLNWFEYKEQREICDRLSTLEIPPVLDEAKLKLDWFSIYLTEGGKKIDSVGRAVKMLADFAKKGRSSHFYGRHDLDELRSVFLRSIDQGDANQATESIRRAEIYSYSFIQLVRATRVLQSACRMEEEELKNLQNQTEQDVQKLRALCKTILKDESTEDIIENYKEVKYLFLRTYERWFPAGGLELQKAAKVIDQFTPKLRDALLFAWENFTPERRKKEFIQMDMTDLEQHESMRVLVDPTVFNTTILQLLDNIDKLAEQGSTIRVLCLIHFPNDERAGYTIPVIGSNQVGISVLNDKTPRPEVSQIRLRGLSDVKTRLSEYDGKLECTIPNNDFSCKVTIILPIWTEVGK